MSQEAHMEKSHKIKQSDSNRSLTLATIHFWAYPNGNICGNVKRSQSEVQFLKWLAPEQINLHKSPY